MVRVFNKKRMVFLFSELKKLPPALLFIALLVGGILCFEARTLLSQRAQGLHDARYLIVQRDLPAGHLFSFLDFSLSSILTDEDLHASRPLTDQELHLLKGARAKTAIRAGEILTFAKVLISAKGLAASVPKGFRGYYLKPDNLIPLHRSDRVDVLLKPEKKGEMAMILIENVGVLEAEASSQGTMVVIAVQQSDIELLEKAEQQGKLILTLRNPEDSSKRVAKGESWNRLRGKKSATIEVISEEQ